MAETYVPREDAFEQAGLWLLLTACALATHASFNELGKVSLSGILTIVFGTHTVAALLAATGIYRPPTQH